MQRPIGAFAGLIRRSRHFDEAVVEARRGPDRVLPSLLILPVKRKQVHDELVDVAQRQHFRRRVLNGHRDEGNVRVGRLGVRVRPPVGFLPGVFEGGDGGGVFFTVGGESGRRKIIAGLRIVKTSDQVHAQIDHWKAPSGIKQKALSCSRIPFPHA